LRYADSQNPLQMPIFGARRMYPPEQIMTAIVSAPDTFIFRWDRHGRKGERCLVLARGTMNSCLVKFEDGFTMVTSRNALKRDVTGRVTPRSQ
jgi:hypothetical protein